MNIVDFMTKEINPINHKKDVSYSNSNNFMVRIRKLTLDVISFDHYFGIVVEKADRGQAFLAEDAASHLAGGFHLD